jgi:hypothetical protein
VIAQETISAIFVAWQHAATRRYYPVGRLAQTFFEDGPLFEFAYIQGANDAAAVGFQPFLAFPELARVYRSRELFPFFSNRVMSRNRADFPAYMARLGLPTDASAMQILARSGGARATDSIELFPLPAREPDREWFLTHFWLHGLRHLAPEGQARVEALQPGERLHCRHEATNAHDSNAMQLFTNDGFFVGYIPRYLASDAVRLLGECNSIEVFVERVNPAPAPSQHRLLCRMESCWPDGFQPCGQDVYKPISAEATAVDPCDANPLP